MNRFTQRALAIFLTAVAAVAGVAITASPANGDSKPIHTTGNVNIRPEPNTNLAPLGVIPAGSSPDYHCYVQGQQVDNTNVWFKVTYNGVTGYYSSRWDNIPMSRMGNLEGNYGIRVCGLGHDMNQTSAGGTTIHVPTTIPNYDGNKAADWALTHSTDKQPLWSGCTYFLSMALWQGGMFQTEVWNWDGTRGLRRVPGTITATATPEFVQYMRDTGWAEFVELGPDRFRDNAVPEARRGDAIIYDWDADGRWDHASIVTSISSGDYPNVAEWGTNQLPKRNIDYPERGWTYSKKHERWLQADNPHVTALLLRIAPGD